LAKVSRHDLGRADSGPERWVDCSDWAGHTFVSATLAAEQKK